MRCSICGWPADPITGMLAFRVHGELVCAVCNGLMGYPVQVIARGGRLLSGERLRAHLRVDVPEYAEEMRGRWRRWSFDNMRWPPRVQASDPYFLTMALMQGVVTR